MRLSEAVKPISYLKSDNDHILSDLSTFQQPIILTKNGKARAILQDIESYEATQESLALLKILTLGSQSKQKGKYKSAKTAFADIRQCISLSEK